MKHALLVLLAVTVAADPAAAQAPPQQQAAQWVRLSLNDGRFVDGYLTGGDAASYFVQTSYGLFSIARANVIAVTPMGTAPVAPPPTAYAPDPNPMPAPMPTPTAQPLAPPSENKSQAFGRGVGIAYFGISYGVVALAASAKSDDDDSAKAGFIPVVGPILWAWGDDEDDLGEDGWDWLAAVGTITQLTGVWLAITGDDRKSKGAKVTAVSTKSYSGFAVVGSW